MSGKQEPIAVEIYGQRYNVRGEGDATYLTELARFVDQRMHEVATQVSSLDPVKIAILAALNIADELWRSRKQQEDAAELWMERTEELADRLGKSLVEQTKRTTA
jgi:cell division protein ZapA